MEKRRTYRAKRLDNNEWVYGSLIEKLAVYGCNYYIVSLAEDKEEEDDQEYKVYYPTIGQCTGRVDVNGKDIYEGDKIKTQWYPSHEEVVEWKDSGEWSIAQYSNPKGVKIVGTIHDKP